MYVITGTKYVKYKGSKNVNLITKQNERKGKANTSVK